MPQNFFMKRFISTIFTLLLFSIPTISAQADNPDFFRSIGKIYVVVAVIVAMFIGIVLFLVFLERKLSKLENQIIDNE